VGDSIGDPIHFQLDGTDDVDDAEDDEEFRVNVVGVEMDVEEGVEKRLDNDSRGVDVVGVGGVATGVCIVFAAGVANGGTVVDDTLNDGGNVIEVSGIDVGFEPRLNTAEDEDAAVVCRFICDAFGSPTRLFRLRVGIVLGEFLSPANSKKSLLSESASTSSSEPTDPLLFASSKSSSSLSSSLTGWTYLRFPLFVDLVLVTLTLLNGGACNPHEDDEDDAWFESALIILALIIPCAPQSCVFFEVILISVTEDT